MRLTETDIKKIEWLFKGQEVLNVALVRHPKDTEAVRAFMDGYDLAKKDIIEHLRKLIGE